MKRTMSTSLSILSIKGSVALTAKKKVYILSGTSILVIEVSRYGSAVFVSPSFFSFPYPIHLVLCFVK